MHSRRARHLPFGLLVGTTQTISARLCRVLMNSWGGFEVKNEVKFDSRKQYFFVANHQSRIDPFTVFGALSLKENFSIAPVRFMTARGLYRSILRPFLWLHGCYPTDRNREKVVTQSVDYVSRGYNLFMFPEGQRTLQAESNPKPGVRLILDDIADDVVIVLAHLEWKVLGVLRRHVTIHLSELPQSKRNLEPKALMDEVYKV